MSQYKRCPNCGYEAPGGWSTPYINLHKCENDHKFCGECKNGDSCPRCQSNKIWWDYEQAYTDKS